MDLKTSESLDKILEKTTKLSFPFFSTTQKKSEFLQKTKDEFENEILNQISFDQELVAKLKAILSALWTNAEKDAKKEFESLPGKLQFNSFYLQEIMHRYVDIIIHSISENN